MVLGDKQIMSHRNFQLPFHFGVSVPFISMVLLHWCKSIKSPNNPGALQCTLQQLMQHCNKVRPNGTALIHTHYQIYVPHCMHAPK